FALKPLLKKDYATLKVEIDGAFAGLGALLKDPLSAAKGLFGPSGDASKGSEGAADAVSDGIRGVLKQGADIAQLVFELPQRLLEKLKKLIWTQNPPETPLTASAAP